MTTQRVNRFQSVIRNAVSNGIPGRSFRVALVVGTLLVIVNQWQALMGDESLSITKTLLTYLVPYLVSTYAAVSQAHTSNDGNTDNH